MSPRLRGEISRAEAAKKQYKEEAMLRVPEHRFFSIVTTLVSPQRETSGLGSISQIDAEERVLSPAPI